MALVALIRVDDIRAIPGNRGPPFSLVTQPAPQCVNPRTDVLQYNAAALPGGGFFIAFAGNTSDRPDGSGGPYPPPRFGDPFFDQTLGKTVWYFAPGRWIDETGTVV